ncbi:hypothetical protein [Mucilaginibacter sp. HD30]
MITKNELLEGLELFYTGKAFAGFTEENPFVTFLGFDRSRWASIWVKYGGRKILTSLKDVKLKRDLTPAI